MNIIHLITILNPFYSLYRLYSEENTDKYSFINEKNEKNGKNIIKYEIYENERWWMFIGWSKDLIFDETVPWYRIDNPDIYFDKSMAILPGGKREFKWENEWKIEKNSNSDENGWEYAKNFKSEFDRKRGKQNVRRRKWVRYAIKI